MMLLVEDFNWVHLYEGDEAIPIDFQYFLRIYVTARAALVEWVRWLIINKIICERGNFPFVANLQSLSPYHIKIRYTRINSLDLSLFI